MLVPNDIYNKIDDIIERSYTGFLYQVLGKDFLTPEQITQVEALGILTSRKSLLELLYLLVKQRSEERYQTDSTLQELLEDIFSTGGFDMLPQRAKVTIENASHTMNVLIDGTKADIAKKVKLEIASANKEFTSWIDLRSPDSEAIEKKKEKSTKKLLAGIGIALLAVNRSFHKDFTGELTDFVNKTTVDTALAVKALNEAPGAVYKVVMHDRCNWCGSAYNNPDGTPKLYKISTLIANGTNDGKSKSQWKPVVGPHHPRCRCQLKILSKKT